MQTVELIIRLNDLAEGDPKAAEFYSRKLQAISHLPANCPAALDVLRQVNRDLNDLEAEVRATERTVRGSRTAFAAAYRKALLVRS